MIEDTIDDLNKLLEFEIGARDTYTQNLGSTKSQSFVKVLEENRKSHSDRVQELQDAIKMLEGKPVTAAKVWGSFGKVLGGATAAMGDDATIDVLSKGEETLSAEYNAIFERRGNSAIMSKLRTRQEESQRLITQLRKSA